MNGVLPKGPTGEQRQAVDNIGLAIVEEVMRVVGVPVGTEQLKRNSVNEEENGEPAGILRALVPIDDALESFQICVCSRFPACHTSFA